MKPAFFPATALTPWSSSMPIKPMWKSRLSSITEQRKSLYRKQRTKAVLDDPAQQEQIRTEIANPRHRSRSCAGR